MEIVAEMPETRVEGFLAAGHAATITGWGIFERFVERHGIPVVVAGFEPLDILAGLVQLVELVRDGTPRVVNMFPRCVTQEGNRNAQERALERVPAAWAAAGAASPMCRTATSGCATSWPTWTRAGVSRSTSRALWDHAPPTLDRRLHLRRHHVGHRVADELHALRQGVRARHSRRRLHGLVAKARCRIWHQYGGHPDL